MLPRIVASFAAAAIAAAGAVVLAQRPPRLMGFTLAATDRERAAERVIASVPSVDKMGDYHVAMTRKPHHTGSDANYALFNIPVRQEDHARQAILGQRMARQDR